MLVVDDDDDASELITRILARAGYEVTRAVDQNQALASIAEDPSRVGVVLVSFTASGSGGGVKLLDTIRSNENAEVTEVRVVIVTDGGKNRMFCWQSGADGLLTRPYHADDMLAEIESARSRPPGEREVHRRRELERLGGVEGDQSPRPGSPFES
ncbi:MAG: hypothetical protein JJLCMIEE_00418 [Acidimicrobiales bacterium]|nr:hypothetical protein [Acidimicrobiales bacterium]